MLRTVWRLVKTCFILWCAGFFGFLIYVLQDPPSPVPSADGIVVLTGGKKRIVTGLELLDKKHGKRLLISGVNKDVSPKALAKNFPSYHGLFTCCVDFDYEAQNTKGNAKETVRWAQTHGIKKLIVVSSNYHMPRTLVHFFNRAGDMELIPYSVQVKPFDETSVLLNVRAMRLLAEEYTKMLPVAAQFVVRYIGHGIKALTYKA